MILDEVLVISLPQEYKLAGAAIATYMFFQLLYDIDLACQKRNDIVRFNKF